MNLHLVALNIVLGSAVTLCAEHLVGDLAVQNPALCWTTGAIMTWALPVVLDSVAVE